MVTILTIHMTNDRRLPEQKETLVSQEQWWLNWDITHLEFKDDKFPAENTKGSIFLFLGFFLLVKKDWTSLSLIKICMS